MYDNTCKYLAENFSSDYAAWLLGRPIVLTKLEPSELSTDPIHADTLIFLESASIVLHLEFQTKPDKSIPFRMADYRLRLYRKYPDREVVQIVIYLRETNSPLVFLNKFSLPGLAHEFKIIRLWEQPIELFENSLGLIPLAVLCKADPVEALKKVVQKLESIPDRSVQGNLAAATYVIAGLKLEKETIGKLLRSNAMKESVTYQEILQEGEEKGLQRGKLEEKQQIALNMLRSGFSLEMVAQLTGLPIGQVQELAQE